MSRYRIIEKKGEYIEHKKVVKNECYDHKLIKNPTNFYFQLCQCKNKDVIGKEYIPRFIVQEISLKPRGHYIGIPAEEFKDIQEFNNLEEARAFKRDLELEDGIVIE